MAKLLQVVQLGDPGLRKISQPVTDIKNKKIQELINDLLATVMDVNGVGIAAPQVYETLRIFIIASHPNPRYPNAPLMDPTPVINPKIIWHNKEKKKDWEGCLSIPGIRAQVPRFTKIKVKFTDRKGKLVKCEFTNDFIARIFQHEFDHLEGLVFLDRVSTNKDIITDKEYQKLIAKKK